MNMVSSHVKSDVLDSFCVGGWNTHVISCSFVKLYKQQQLLSLRNDRIHAVDIVGEKLLHNSVKVATNLPFISI